MYSTQSHGLTISLNRENHQLARQFSLQQDTVEKGEQVYLNTLAVCAVHNFLDWMGIETELSQGDSWNSVVRCFRNVADLAIPNLGKLECRPVNAGETSIIIPPEVSSERIGYVAVQFEEQLNEVQLLGYYPVLDSQYTLPQLEIANLYPIEELIDYLVDGIPVEDVQVHSQAAVVGNTWMQSLQNFQHRLQEGWKQESAMLGKYAQQLMFGSGNEFDFLLHAEAGTGKVDTIDRFIQLLGSSDTDVSFRAAVELGDRDTAKPEVIAALVKRLETAEEINTRWQIALSLGKFQPDNPDSAIAQSKEVQLAQYELGLIVALKRDEDDLVNVLLHVYSPDGDELPRGLEVVVLSDAGKKIRQEDGETFVEANVKAEELYINLYAFGTPGERFTIKLSLGDASTTETFTV